MVHFVGAGPGAPDLITVRGAELLKKADCIIFAGSLANPALLDMAREDCDIYDSAVMTLEEVLQVMKDKEQDGKDTVRLHTGDMSLYGAIREQMDRLDEMGIPYDDTPGVSAFSGAASAICAEYTLPGVSQSVIITRMEGETPVPEKESIASGYAFDRHAVTVFNILSKH
jgi:precorrin-4/cobalt-precorrin-4 C11-methyltransferase